MTLSHIDKNGKANMVDVGLKPDQLRIAKASGFIKLSKEAIKLIKENNIACLRLVVSVLPLSVTLKPI